MPRVSFIIPTYNRADLLPFTLDSVLAQTHRDLEIIVMDNASTDDTQQVMADYTARDARIRYVRNPTNIGMIPNYNAGLRLATGEYVNFLDSDDTLEPTKVEKQVAYFEAYPQTDVLYTRFYITDYQGRPLQKTWLLPEGDVLPVLIIGTFIFWGSLLMRRAFVQQVGLDESVVMVSDWDFLLRSAIEGARFACIQEALGNYRQHAHSISRNHAKENRALELILERAYAHPKLPPHVAALKVQSQTILYLWAAYGAYDTKSWDDGQRHLREAWRLNPHWRRAPDVFIARMYERALHVRVHNPVAFIRDVLDHWPEEVEFDPAARRRLLALVQLGYGLRLYGFNQLDAARRLLAASAQTDPSVIKDLDVVEPLLLDQATTALVDSPTEYVKTVLANLPPEAQLWHKQRRRILANISVVSAFGSYYTNGHQAVPKEVLFALRNRPSLVRNRGLLSIFARSLLY